MTSIIKFIQRQSIIFALSLPFVAFGADAPAGVGNFQKVNDHVYRGAQPTEAGFRNLAGLGVQTVVDLQEPGTARSVSEARAVKAAGMQYISVPMRGMQTPKDESVARALAVLEDNKGGPIFVHCHRGADRTGGIIACYRIEHDHWANDRALAEARSMGMSWFQTAIQHYVLNYQPRSHSVPVLAGIAPVSPQANPAGPAGFQTIPRATAVH